jgi:RNA polymerase sigma factor (sigma-70 family)
VEQLTEHPDDLSIDPMPEQLERQLENALRELLPTHLAVLLLHKRDGLSYEAVAERLGISVHTVRKYLYQARTQVRARWKQMDKRASRWAVHYVSKARCKWPGKRQSGWGF